jgi:trimethylamine--corrinoid protein Co-methyltransferase
MRDELYQFPIWSFAGSTDSKVIDAQAGAEGMLSIITSLLSRCNVIHDVGYIESGHTSSLEMLVMADELIAMSKFFGKGIPVNEKTLALDIIDRVANGPDNAIFLSDPHTFAHFKTAHLLPELMDRSRFDSWEKEGKTDLFTRCNEKAKALLSSHKVKKTPRAEDALAAL